MAEVKNHNYAFEALKAMPPDQTRGIFIPEIYRTFESGDRFFIDWESQEGTAVDSIARAIGLLTSIQAPPGQKPGPVGGDRIRYHPGFGSKTSHTKAP
ncbi:hypothetical protein VM1G_11639 [Cytospora mali]|uniref:Uncharacterized protein n=1 Tax=Cytospora mali TaxID=578113 RepID=A0A194VZP8_CYTMA|nr:hypothetical protein VM1G_11639 [Valsa mali]